MGKKDAKKVKKKSKKDYDAGHGVHLSCAALRPRGFEISFATKAQ